MDLELFPLLQGIGLVFEEHSIFPFMHTYAHGLWTAAFSHWWWHQCNFLHFRKRLHFNSWDSLQFLVGNRNPTKASLFPWGSGNVLGLSQPLIVRGQDVSLFSTSHSSLPQSPHSMTSTLSGTPNYIIIVDTLVLCPEPLFWVDILLWTSLSAPRFIC